MKDSRSRPTSAPHPFHFLPWCLMSTPSFLHSGTGGVDGVGVKEVSEEEKREWSGRWEGFEPGCSACSVQPWPDPTSQGQWLAGRGFRS